MIAQKTKKLSLRERVIAAIGNLPEWFTTMEAASLLGLTRASTQNAIYQMAAEGELERIQVAPLGVYGRGYKYRRTAQLGVRAPGVKTQVIVFDATHNIFNELIRKGHDEDFQHKLPMFATAAIPGSKEKIDIMAARVANGESPNHPDDLRAGRQLGKIPNGWWEEAQ